MQSMKMDASLQSGAPKPGAGRKVIHPWPLRVMHWLNAVAIVTLIGSGWQIYNASPFLPFIFPHWATIGEWLGAVRSGQ